MARKKKELVVVQEPIPAKTGMCEGCKHHEHANNDTGGIHYCNALNRQLNKGSDGVLQTPSDCPLKK